MHRRDLLARIAGLPLALGLTGCSGALPALVAPAPAGPSDPFRTRDGADGSLAAGGTLIVIRHAAAQGATLSEVGKAQAAELGETLAGVEIDGIYLPPVQPAIDTARPLADARRLEIQLIPPTDVAQTMFRRQPGGTLVWIGTASDIAALWTGIGAPGSGPATDGAMEVVPVTATGPEGKIRATMGR